jgi:hypothetical protein
MYLNSIRDNDQPRPPFHLVESNLLAVEGNGFTAKDNSVLDDFYPQLNEAITMADLDCCRQVRKDSFLATEARECCHLSLSWRSLCEFAEALRG